MFCFLGVCVCVTDCQIHWLRARRTNVWVCVHVRVRVRVRVCVCACVCAIVLIIPGQAVYNDWACGTLRSRFCVWE